MSLQETVTTTSSTLEIMGISTVHDMLEIFVLAVCASITGFVFSEIVVYLWEIRTSLRTEFRDHKDILERRLTVIKKFGERHARLTNDVELIDEEIEKISTVQGQMTNKRKEIQDLQSRRVRTIGQPVKGTRCFRALVTNVYVKECLNNGTSHQLYDESWAKTQIVEVWADSNAFALLVLRQKYAQSQGFSVDKIEQAQADTGTPELP